MCFFFGLQVFFNEINGQNHYFWAKYVVKGDKNRLNFYCNVGFGGNEKFNQDTRNSINGCPWYKAEKSIVGLWIVWVGEGGCIMKTIMFIVVCLKFKVQRGRLACVIMVN